LEGNQEIMYRVYYLAYTNPHDDLSDEQATHVDAALNDEVLLVKARLCAQFAKRKCPFIAVDDPSSPMEALDHRVFPLPCVVDQSTQTFLHGAAVRSWIRQQQKQRPREDSEDEPIAASAAPATPVASVLAATAGSTKRIPAPSKTTTTAQRSTATARKQLAPTARVVTVVPSRPHPLRHHTHSNARILAAKKKPALHDRLRSLLHRHTDDAKQ
jgi:hypothetical protein